jgi:hypothetical protein
MTNLYLLVFQLCDDEVHSIHEPNGSSKYRGERVLAPPFFIVMLIEHASSQGFFT